MQVPSTFALLYNLTALKTGMDNMNSCLYQTTVMHHRLQPRRHRFHYRVFMFYIDLSEIDLLKKKYWLFSHNKFNFFSFRDKEHLQLPVNNPDTAKTTREHITDYLQQHGIRIGQGRVMLLTNLNVLGYNFNPVSFYYCFDDQQQPLCCIAEVSNTFREMKPFLLDKSCFNGDQFHLHTKKLFYVSPFMDHDVMFDFNLYVPAQKLNLRIDDYQEKERIFISTVSGERKALTNARLLFYSLRFPFITGKIIFLIHWNALLLWLKKIPYHRKASNPHLQKDVYRRYKPQN